MDRDFNSGFMPPFMDYNMPPPGSGNVDMNDLYKDPMFNPMMQYEQAYCYYRYLCMQIDYKIKCKEYERICKSSSERPTRKVE